MANLEEILVEVKAVHVDVGKLLQWKAELDERCHNRGKKLERVSDTLYGNPSSNHGLTTKVQQLWNCKKQLKESRNKNRDFWLFILRSLIIAGIIALAGWLLVTYRNESNQPGDVPSRQCPDLCRPGDTNNQVKGS